MHDEKSRDVESGPEDNFSGAQVNYRPVISPPVTCSTKDEKTTQVPEDNPEANNADQFNNQAYEHYPEDSNEKDSDQTNEAILGVQSCKRVRSEPTGTYNDETENAMRNKTDVTSDDISSINTSNSDTESPNENTEAQFNVTNNDILYDEISLVKDSVMTIDAAAVPARHMTPELENQDHPPEVAFQGMVSF